MGLGAVLRRVFLAQRQRVHAQFLGQLVEGAFHRKGGDRRAGRAIGRDLGAVADDVIADDVDILDVVEREAAHAAWPDRGAGEGTGLEFSICFAATMVPSFFAPILISIAAPEVGPEPRNTSSRVICIFTGLPDLRDSATATGSR